MPTRIHKLPIKHNTFVALEERSANIRKLQSEIQLVIDTVIDCSDLHGKNVTVKKLERDGILVEEETPETELVKDKGEGEE